MLHGSAYYPEHRPASLWAQDARWMREAGMNLARVTDFAWCRLEVSEGVFTFDWLAQVIDLLHAEGIGTVITVPTAGPTAWLVEAKRPEDDCRMVYEDGRPWDFGGRSMTCPGHPRFRGAAARISTALAQRFANHPGIIGWQLDNELGMFGTRCFCTSCVSGFRAWLERKYGTIEALNERLGMVFGSGEFRTFADVPLPRLGQGLHSPGLKLDSQRFFQQINAEFLAIEARALRAAGATQPITHNVCHMFSGWQGQDDPQLFAELDVAGWDCYPVQFAPHPRPETLGLLHACARSYKNGKRYWMLEQQIGSPMDAAADDLRQVRLWAWQAVAHGAEALTWFRWDTARFGGEQYWRGILDHVPRKNARYDLVAQFGAELMRHAPLMDRLTRPRRAAVLLDVASTDSWKLEPPGPNMPYRDIAARWFGALSRAGCAADVVTVIPEPGTYEVLVATGLRLVDATMIARLRTFVAAGGTLISGVALATLDREHVAPAEPVPWGLTDVVGCERLEFSTLSPSLAPPKERLGEHAGNWASLGRNGAVPVVGDGPLAGGTYSVDTWCDHMEAQGCAVWARFAAGSPPAGLPAVTCHEHGRGLAIYVAGLVDETLADAVVAQILVKRTAGGSSALIDLHAPRGDGPWVEIVPVQDGAKNLWFVLNHGHSATRLTLAQKMRDHLSDDREVADLAPYQIRLLERAG